MLETPLCFLLGGCLVAAGEYAIHRWLMHRPASEQWRLHAVEHHRDGAMERDHMNISWQSLGTLLILTAPIWIWAALFLSSWMGVILAAELLWWKATWHHCHALAHQRGGSWWAAYLLCPWVIWVVRHHLDHHKFPSHNFGAVFPWTDYVMGTAV